MRSLVVLVAATAAAVPATASADVFKLYGELHGGGMFGKKYAGEAGDQGFFAQSKGGAYGFLAGGQFLILDGHIKHHQYPNAEDGLSTWTQFNVGLNFGINTGSEKDKKEHKGGYFELGVWAGFGLATGAQVDPPLNNEQVSDKGFMLDTRIGFGKHLSKVFDLGVAVPASWGYFLRNGDGAVANDISSHYQSIQIEALLVLRANIRFI
jgi:hypothetical protein